MHGGPKEMSCRVALLRMHEDGLVTLPPPRWGNGNGRRYTRRSSAAEPQPVQAFSLPQLGEVRLEIVTAAESHLWNEYIDRYHYLGYHPLPGDWQDRYGIRPLLVESFVDRWRFPGTCYRAANWILVGQTQGRGKKDRYKRRELPPKDIWLFPLHRRAQKHLCR